MLKREMRNRFGKEKKVSTLELQCRADELGIDPFEVLLLFAKGDSESLGLPINPRTGMPLPVDPKVQFSAASEACKYLFPQLKATELTGPEGGPLQVRSELAQKILDTAYEEALNRKA